MTSLSQERVVLDEGNEWPASHKLEKIYHAQAFSKEKGNRQQIKCAQNQSLLPLQHVQLAASCLQASHTFQLRALFELF